MNRALIPGFVMLALAGASVAFGQSAPAWKDKMYFGGFIGASFGDIDYLELAPLVGYRVHPRVATGVGLFYRWKSDDRYESSIDTTDYGGNLFAQVTVWREWFATVEYEYVDYEYATFSGETFRDSDSNLLAGPGISSAVGGRTGFYASALYNFSYDDNDPLEPYDSPWVYRVGVTFGF